VCSMELVAELLDAPAGELADAIDQLAAVECATRRQLLQLVHAYGQRESYRADGCSDMAMWLRDRLDMSNASSRLFVDVAAALESLPAIAATFEAGRLSWHQLVFLCRFAPHATAAELAEPA